MGKSPGRWIKTVLFGKKISKSHSVKGRERTVNEKQVLVAATPLECDAISDPVISHPIPVPTVNSEGRLEHGSQDTADLLHFGGESLPGKQEANFQFSIPQVELSDDDRRRQEEAATLVQAAFRGYLARRAFRALRGIIRLQALIRGHLVRRQAVATLCCVLGVVKLQALARGVKVRNSDIGREVQRKRHGMPPLEIGNSDGVHVSIIKARLSANPFARKLVASSPIAMPLCLHYDSKEPNSVANWLACWSASSFWKPMPQPKKVLHSKTLREQGNSQMLETEAVRPKRSAQRIPASNIESSLVQTSEFEKPKRNVRKVLSHPADNVQENPQTELEKVKRNLRKVRNSVMESPVQSEVDIEKPKQSLEKVLGTTGDNHLVRSTNNSREKMKKETNLTPVKLSDVVKNEPTLTISKLPDVEMSLEPVRLNEVSEIHGDQPVIDPKPFVGSGRNDENIPFIGSDCNDENTPFINGELSLKEDPPSNQNHKSNRKASSLVKQERAENGLESSSPTLPSYMAATESAKAKLRAQGSPKLIPEAAEKNNLSRRHSLPSSANSKISSETPRTRAVHSGGKAGRNKNDRSILSSREGNAKVVQVEWRR